MLGTGAQAMDSFGIELEDSTSPAAPESLDLGILEAVAKAAGCPGNTRVVPVFAALDAIFMIAIGCG